MAKLEVILDQEEVHQHIAYRLIYETMSCSVWSTGRRRRRWREEFTEAERDTCSRLKAQAYRWFLVTGVPDEVRMSLATYTLWKKLEAFCASL